MQVGVYLSKDLMTISGHSLKANITTLGPLVLPWSEQLRFLANLFARKVGRLSSLPHNSPHCSSTVLPFLMAIAHSGSGTLQVDGSSITSLLVPAERSDCQPMHGCHMAVLSAACALVSWTPPERCSHSV